MSTLDAYVKSFGDVKGQRSHKLLHRTTKHSLFHGYFHPVGSPIEVLPGDTFKAKLSAFIRMSTPIVPFMDDVRFECDAYFVPKRILNHNTKEFYGEAKDFGIAQKFEEPYFTFGSTHTLAVAKSTMDSQTNLIKSESFASVFGFIVDDASSGTLPTKFNALTVQGALAIYNQYYRDENYQSQYMWDKDAKGLQSEVAFFSGTEIEWNSLLPNVCKDRDLITTILPWQVKGTPVVLGIGESAPVFAGGAGMIRDLTSDQRNNIHFISDVPFATGTNYDAAIRGVAGPNASNLISTDGAASSANVKGTYLAPNNLYADLRNATGVSISDLVYSLSYQNFLARSAKYGTKYKEYIYSMFQTVIPDASEDIPEYLGRLKFNINVNTVVQTTGFAASSSTELGSLGAYSASGNSAELFNKSFTEPGYVYLIMYTKHKRTYSSGIDRVFLKTEFLDYYQPPLASIYDIPFMRNHVWLSAYDDVAIGWQEPWFDYNSLEDRAYGLMNPAIDSLGEIWTLAEKWVSAPTISASFLKEDRDAIARVLATGVNGPDYLVDMDLLIDTVRVMPVASQLALKVM